MIISKSHIKNLILANRIAEAFEALKGHPCEKDIIFSQLRDEFIVSPNALNFNQRFLTYISGRLEDTGVASKFFEQASNEKDVYKAISLYTEALTLDSNYIDAYICRADAKRTLKLYKEAIDDYDEAIRIKPDSIDVYIMRGHTHYDLKLYADAIKDYKIVTLKAPEHADAYWHIALSYSELRNKEETLAYLEKAIELNILYKKTATTDASSIFNWLMTDKKFIYIIS